MEKAPNVSVTSQRSAVMHVQARTVVEGCHCTCTRGEASGWERGRCVRRAYGGCSLSIQTSIRREKGHTRGTTTGAGHVSKQMPNTSVDASQSGTPGVAPRLPQPLLGLEESPQQQARGMSPPPPREGGDAATLPRAHASGGTAQGDSQLYIGTCVTNARTPYDYDGVLWQVLCQTHTHNTQQLAQPSNPNPPMLAAHAPSPRTARPRGRQALINDQWC